MEGAGSKMRISLTINILCVGAGFFPAILLPMRVTPQDTVRCRFFAPIETTNQVLAHRRQCPEFSDEEFIESGNAVRFSTNPVGFPTRWSSNAADPPREACNSYAGFRHCLLFFDLLHRSCRRYTTPYGAISCVKNLTPLLVGSAGGAFSLSIHT